MVHNPNAKGYLFSGFGFSTKGQQLLAYQRKQNHEANIFHDYRISFFLNTCKVSLIKPEL